MKISQGRSALDELTTLVELVYELLDAHDDTARLATDTPDDERWAPHLDYLRQLQRVGREALAHADPSHANR